MNKLKHKLVQDSALILILIFPTALVISQGMTAQDDWSQLNVIDFENPVAVKGGELVEYSIGNNKSCECTAGAESTCPGINRTLEFVEVNKSNALQLRYNLTTSDNCWTQVICEFNPPINISASDHLLIDWRGNSSSANSLEVGLVAGGKNYFAQQPYHRATQKAWSGLLVIPLESFGNKTYNPDLTNIERIFISVKNYRSKGDTGGAGTITIDSIKSTTISSRKVPSDFEQVEGNKSASKAAAKWLASQQQPTGLLKSWEEEKESKAHMYDQALALIIFSQENMWSQSDKLAGALINLQNRNGSWYQTYNSSDASVIASNEWEGDIAWVVYALDRYKKLGGKHPNSEKAVENGANWLQGQIDSRNGCLMEENVEGAMDVWWALQAVGQKDKADALKECLMFFDWDEKMGRFKIGKDNSLPVLDVQTWGAALLKADGEKDRALRALSYAREVLLVSSQDGHVGLGDHAGPWTIWNDGTAQYIVAGGVGSNEFLQGLSSQQRKDGAMPGSPDDFYSSEFWNTKWHGVAPTAWLYFATSSGPFNASTMA